MEELTPLLEQLAAQLNTTVEFLWEVLVRQARVVVIKSILYWSLWIIFLISTGFGFKYMVKRIDDIDEDTFSWLIAFPTFILLAWFVFNIIYTNSMLDALLNPEYWALQQILEFIK